MSVAHGRANFGGQLVQCLSDDLALGVGSTPSRGFYDLGHCGVLLDVEVFMSRHCGELDCSQWGAATLPRPSPTDCRRLAVEVVRNSALGVARQPPVQVT